MSIGDFSSPSNRVMPHNAVHKPVASLPSDPSEWTVQMLLEHGHRLPKDDYFEQCRQLAMEYIDDVLDHFVPNGKHRGREYVAYNPLRNDGALGSFSINTETGVWAEFAEDVTGADVISYIQYIQELEYYSQATKVVLEYLATITTPAQAERSIPTHKPVLPVESSAFLPIAQSVWVNRPVHFGSNLGSPSARYPYHTADGQPCMEVLRFHVAGDKTIRPLSYLPDKTGKMTWQLKIPQGKRPLYNLHLLATKPQAIVIIAEGEKTADAAQQLFPECVVTTTMGGALAPEKTDFAPLKGRKVLIAPDFDEAGLKYRDKVAVQLRDVEAIVGGYMRVELLSKNGEPLPAGYDLADAVDDGWTREELDALQDLWVRLPDTTPADKDADETSAERSGPIDPEQSKQPASDKSVASLNNTKASDAKQRPSQKSKSDPNDSAFGNGDDSPNSADELVKWCQQRDRKPSQQEWAQLFAQLHFERRLAFCSNRFLGYTNGYWKTLNVDLDIRHPLMILHGHKATASDVNGILETLQILYTADPQPYEQRSSLICLINGTLNPATGELLPHNPMHNLTNRVDITFDPRAACPVWDQTLAEIFAPDADRALKIQLIQEFFGYCLIPDTRLPQFLWLVGAGGNGKSLVLDILTALIGEGNISYAQIERFQEKYVRAELQNKLVNISSEMSAEATVSDGYLKQITGGDMIEAERKFQPSFSFRPYCRIIAATNVLPRLLDHSDGFFRRAMIVRFNRQFKGSEIDPLRKEKLMAELSGILNWAVQGLQRLLVRGRYEIPPSCLQELNTYKVNSDPVLQFATDWLTKTENRNSATGSQFLYDEYKQWALSCGYRPLAVAQFSERLKGLGYESFRNKKGVHWMVIHHRWGLPDTAGHAANEPEISELAKNYQV